MIFLLCFFKKIFYNQFIDVNNVPKVIINLKIYIIRVKTTIVLFLESILRKETIMPKDELKNKIITIAEGLFRENNYKDVSIREISNLAGISIGSFYRHIGSKEKLFELFHYKLKNDLTNTIIIKTSNQIGIKKIEVLLDTYIDIILEYGYKCTALFLILSLEKKAFSTPPKTLYTFLRNYVDEAAKNGEFNENYDTDYIFKALYSSIRGTVFDWCTYKGTSDLKGDFLLTFDILINKFKKQ